MKISKIVASLLVVGTSIVFANGTGDRYDGKMDKGCTGQKMQHSDKHNFDMMDKRGHYDGGAFMKIFMDTVHKTELTAEQKANIKKIFDENKPNMTSPVEAFGDTKFDAQKFVDIMQNKKSEMLKHEADIIGKVYGILTTEQKAIFKKELGKQKDNRLEMMKGRHDKGDVNRR